MYERKIPVDLDCPLRLTMSLIGAKWKSCIIDELPPRSEYSLSELGRSLIPIIDSLLAWGEGRIETARRGMTNFFMERQKKKSTWNQNILKTHQLNRRGIKIYRKLTN